MKAIAAKKITERQHRDKTLPRAKKGVMEEPPGKSGKIALHWKTDIEIFLAWVTKRCNIWIVRQNGGNIIGRAEAGTMDSSL